MLPYAAILTAVQHLVPTWRKTQHVNLAQLLTALLQRPALCLSDLARARPQPTQPLHGRLKRLSRFLANPRLDELALAVRWLKLSYHFSTALPEEPAETPLLPIVLDTTYFEPYAALIASVPCGSRALPIVLVTYHRTELTACFPPQATWPPAETGAPRPAAPAASVVRAWDSQNLIEEHLIDLVWPLSSAALQRVLVADRGFARASLFQHLLAAGRDFVIRIDAETHLWLTSEGPSQPVAQALALRVGERRWLAEVWYHSQEKVPIALLALWEAGYKEPWYLATSLNRADWVELLYRWRMRIETANRDEKTGVLLREGGDAHALRSLLHLHRLLLALCTAHWLCALVGLQALHELDPALAALDVAPALPLALAPPDSRPTAALLAQGPALPPPVQPHRGPPPKLAAWEKRFAARGHLSYVRLGCEVLRAPDLGGIVRKLAHWLGVFLWCYAPAWSRRQRRYRRRTWWDTS